MDNHQGGSFGPAWNLGEFRVSVARRMQVLAITGVHWRLKECASLLYPSRSQYGERRLLRVYLFTLMQGGEILRLVNLDLRSDGVRCSSHLSGTSFPPIFNFHQP